MGKVLPDVGADQLAMAAVRKRLRQKHFLDSVVRDNWRPGWLALGLGDESGNIRHPLCRAERAMEGI